MEDQKIDNLLNLALDMTEEEREKSWNLNVGFEKENKTWEIIVKYSGDLTGLAGENIQIQQLLGGYAVVTLPEGELEAFSSRPQIEYIEKPKRLYFSLNEGKRAGCINVVQQRGVGRNETADALSLSGKGILMGIVDSGIDYRHPDFRNTDGTTRILKLWDQTQTMKNTDRNNGQYESADESITKRETDRVYEEVFYTQDEINTALRLSPEEGYRLVPERDYNGHGTAVAGIAAGNGRASDGEYRGIAYESNLLAVKLGTPHENSFPRTTELMRGVDVLIREAIKLGRPIVINISFGNNYGSHLGDSLLETYLGYVAGIGRNVIVVGAGNNGNDNLHTEGKIRSGEMQEIELGISAYEAVLNVQLWKSYADQIEIYLENPSGERIGPLPEQIGTQRFRLGNTELFFYYGKPGPFHISQEIYLDFLPIGSYIDSGVWKIILRGRAVKQGNYSLWLPGGGVLNPATGFFFPAPEGTLTIPSSTSKVLSVGAYDSRLNAYADFSGRGSARFPYLKPDLAAPGVQIMAPRAGGSYGFFTGTSFAAPFVSGAAALLMEWGIVKGNDPFLYGEKVKAYLQRGAKPVAGYAEYPNYEVGYGALCVRESLPI